MLSTDERATARKGREKRVSPLPWLDRPVLGQSQQPSDGTARNSAPQLGVVIALEEGRPIVRLVGSGEEIAVTVLSTVSDAEVVEAIEAKRPALVLRSGDGGVLLGWTRAEVEESAPEAPEEKPPETLLLEAEKRIEIRCGDSSLVLEENGKVVLRGSYLLSRSTGPNKVKGATIELN